MLFAFDAKLGNELGRGLSNAALSFFIGMAIMALLAAIRRRFHSGRGDAQRSRTQRTGAADPSSFTLYPTPDRT